MRRAKRQESDICVVGIGDFRLWHVCASRFVLPVEAIHIVLVIVWTLTVSRILVMAASAREVRRGGMIRSGQCAVRDAVAVDIAIALETSELFEILGRKHLTAI